MYISKVIVRNFRNFHNAVFKFQKGINTLIGENATGKTNILYAIRLLIDSNLPIRATQLSETDFNRALECWKGHWIIISLEFDDLSSSEEEQILACHGIKHMDEDSKSGTYTFYFRPNKAIRQKLYMLSNDAKKNKEKLEELLREISIDEYQGTFLCRGTADFSDDNMYKTYVGDFDKIEFPDPEDPATDQLGCPTPQVLSLPKEVSCTFVKALRDVMSELKYSKNNSLIKLLRGKESEISIEDAEKITSQVKSLNDDIGELEEIKSISQGIGQTLKDAVGKTYAPNINIKSELPDDVERLLQSLTLWVGDADDSNYQGRMNELSLGGANLIYIALKLFEYDINQSAEKMAHFLLIEEPEAHVHTHIQKTLLDKITGKTQVIISTHSTHISAASKISSINVLCREKKEAKVYQPSNNLETKQISRIERYLDAIRSTLLFAKGIILVEGDAEMILMPALIKAVFGLSLDEIGVSVISMNSAVFENVAVIFAEERINKCCAILTDLDKSIVTLNVDPGKDDAFEKKCRDSQEAGLLRKEKINDLCKGNKYLQVFYGEYTFEVDFLLCPNVEEICEVLKDIYQKKTEIEKSKKLLNDENPEVGGKELLRLLKKVGKGWFSLILAEYINHNTYIPDYILRALAFASSKQMNLLIFAQIAKHRINEGIKNKDTDFIPLEKFLKDNDTTMDEELIKKYKQTLRDDDLTTFIDYCEKC